MRRHGFTYRKLASVPGKLNPAIAKAQKGETERLFCDVVYFTLVLNRINSDLAQSLSGLWVK
jgi:hypothetical protein